MSIFSSMEVPTRMKFDERSTSDGDSSAAPALILATSMTENGSGTTDEIGRYKRKVESRRDNACGSNGEINGEKRLVVSSNNSLPRQGKGLQ